jgi:hypothetical protein
MIPRQSLLVTARGGGPVPNSGGAGSNARQTHPELRLPIGSEELAAECSCLFCHLQLASGLICLFCQTVHDSKELLRLADEKAVSREAVERSHRSP